MLNQSTRTEVLSDDDLHDLCRFQMVSLSQFAEVTEEGVLFASPFTGEPTMLTVSRTSYLRTCLVRLD